ncbi:MAG TPA: helix-turn-helix domain-containing protein [Syntrophales bacterium]|nr:helix-turn-helix domain-containing protein [Syntrophales bacterium]
MAGNVRELQSAIERAALIAESGVIETENLPATILDSGDMKPSAELKEGVSIDDQLQRLEKRMIIRALLRADGKQIKAAQLLGIKERSLWHRIRKYEIDVPSLKKQQNM